MEKSGVEGRLSTLVPMSNLLQVYGYAVDCGLWGEAETLDGLMKPPPKVKISVKVNSRIDILRIE